MDASLKAQFMAACGATGPLEIVVEREDGVVVAHGSLDQPFAVLGSGPGCDVLLGDPAVCPRHAFLQVVGGHVFAGDLGSRGGLAWADGRRPYGWLVPGEPVQVGPFRVYLARPVSDYPAAFDPGFHPLAALPDDDGLPTDAVLGRGLKPAAIEFRNGRTARATWDVNRVVTLVGRGKECKIHLGGDDVSRFHCYMVRTADGLWVVDLLGRGGVVIRGEPARLGLLGHDDEFRVGRFVIGCQYPVPPAADDGRVSFDVPEAERPRRPAEDEVARFRVTATPSVIRTPAARPQPTMAAPYGTALPVPGAVEQLFGPLPGDRAAAVHRELTRMNELNGEWAKARAAARRDRIAALDAERQEVWRRLFGMLTPGA